MKTAGAAWATLVSEYIGCFLAFLLIKKHFEYLSTPFKWRNFFHSPTSHLAYFRASQHLFIRTLCLLACFTFFAAQGARFGSDVVAANAILLSLLALTALMMDAFAYAAETLGGEAWGKNKQNEFRAIVVATWYLATLIAIACCAVLLLWKEPIISLYTDIPAVITETTKQYLWLAWMPLLAIHSYQLDGIFIGIGKTRAMQNAMLAASILVFLPACLTIGTDNNSGLWLSFWLFQSARLIFLAPCLFLILRRSSSVRKQL